MDLYQGHMTHTSFLKKYLVINFIDLENISTSRVGIVGEQGIMSPAYIRLVLTQRETKHKILLLSVFFFISKTNI